MISTRLIKFKTREVDWNDEPYSETPDDLMYGSSGGMFFLFDPEDPKSMHCLTCRDEFAWEWGGCDEPDYECEAEVLGEDGKHRWIGFSIGEKETIDVKRLNRVWIKLEKRMGVGRGLRHPGTVFYRADVSGTVVLRLSPFWVQSSTHRSVCTLVLRMIAIYGLQPNGSERTLDEMIQSYHHAADCEPALKRFLAGYTKPTYGRWNDAFRTWQDKYDEWNVSGSGSEFDEPEPDCLADGENHFGFVAEFTNRPLTEIRRKLVKP